jgi:hypothetical protein
VDLVFNLPEGKPGGFFCLGKKPVITVAMGKNVWMFYRLHFFLDKKKKYKS